MPRRAICAGDFVISVRENKAQNGRKFIFRHIIHQVTEQGLGRDAAKTPGLGETQDKGREGGRLR